MSTVTSPASAAADPFAADTGTSTPQTAAAASTDAFAADPFGAAAAVEPAGLSGQDWIIAVGVIVAAAIVFFFVRSAVQTNLARGRVAPDAASGAAWTLFGFLVVLTATVVFGVVGDLWSVSLFLWPAVGLTLVMLVLTAVMFSSAFKRRR